MHTIPTSAGGYRPPIRRLVPVRALAMFSLLSLSPFTRAEMARPADSFVDSIGVNTHFGTGGAYAIASQTPTILRESGIRYIRNNSSRVPSLHDNSHPNKIKSLVVIDRTDLTIPTIIGWLEQDDVLGVEGLNEPDNWARTWNGYSDDPASGDYSGARAFQRDLYDAAKASATAKLKPVVSSGISSATKTGMLSPLPFDKLSLHPYTSGEHPGSWRLDREGIPFIPATTAIGQSPQGIWITEMGFHNAGMKSGIWQRPVTESAAGKYVPRMLALNFNRRIEKTFIYELIDIGTSTTNQEWNWGLLRNDRTKKPAFHAVQNLISLLADSGPAFAPGALNLTLTGDNIVSVNRTLLQKRNGDYYLLLWQEVSSCKQNPSPPEDIEVATVPVTVNFGGGTAAVTTYTNLAAASYQTSSTVNVSSLTLDVPDEIVVLKISGLTSAGSGVAAPASGPDLVITKVWAEPAEPIVGEPTTLHVTVHNRGTANAAASTVKMRFDGWHNDHPLTFAIGSLAAGASETQSQTWTPSLTSSPASGPGNHVFALTCDAGGVVAETNENNNRYLFTIPVVNDRWTEPCDSLSNWTASHTDPDRWVVQTVGARTYFAYTHPGEYGSGKLTHTLATPLSANWKLDFEHNWRWGAGDYVLSAMADVLDSAGNGYRVRIHQGVRPSAGNVGKLIRLFKVTNHQAATEPLAEGPGYDRPGDSTSQNFMPVSLIFDRATQSLSVYMDLDGDGVMEQSIPPVRDTNNPTTTFHKVVLSAHDAYNWNAVPKFDNIRLSRGMVNLVPAPYFVDRLDNLDQWTDVTNWVTNTSAGNTYVQNTAKHSAGTMTHVFPTVLSKGWTVGFDYDFRYGGAQPSSALKWGHDNVLLRAEMLDANNNGYGVSVRQGDSGNASLNGEVIVVTKIESGARTIIGKGIGYNTPGWLSLQRTRPDFKRVAFSYNRAMQTLSVLIDVDRNGVMEQVIGPIQNVSYTEFSKLVLSANDSQGGDPGVGPMFDNIEVGLIQ